jgi:hypothetical protein
VRLCLITDPEPEPTPERKDNMPTIWDEFIETYKCILHNLSMAQILEMFYHHVTDVHEPTKGQDPADEGGW